MSSPNKMIWSCFRSLQRNIENIEDELDSNTIKDIAAANIILSVTTVETFINMYFRVLVEEEKYKNHKELILQDTLSENGDRAKGLKYKLNSWPNKILNKNINFDNGIAKEFEEMRNIRNDLTHFTSKYEQIEVENIKIQGLANTDSFDNLKKKDTISSLRIAKEFIEYILFLSGVKKKQIPHVIHQWTGLVPEN